MKLYTFIYIHIFGVFFSCTLLTYCLTCFFGLVVSGEILHIYNFKHKHITELRKIDNTMMYAVYRR